MPEKDVFEDILKNLPPNQRLFRINSGMGWSGELIKRTPQTVVLNNPRPLHAAPTGWPDLCGWTSIEITPEMVGSQIAVFTAIEVKVTGRLSRAQQALGDVLKAMGGVFKVVS
jgi:hypothetical protein